MHINNKVSCLYVKTINLLFLVSLCFFMSCNKEQDLDWKPIYASNNLKRSTFKDYRLTKEEKGALNLITEQKHKFSPLIAFNKVEYFITSNNNLTFLWEVDTTKTDFKELQKWKIGMILKPENSDEFEDLELKKRGIKTMGVLTNLMLIDNNVIIALEDFMFKPSKLSYIKFYLYNNEGEVNLTYWTTENIKFTRHANN